MAKGIYIESLKLKNFRTFVEGELSLRNEQGVLPQWTLILGDNNIGKSSLLQCIAWMKPFLPYELPVPPDFDEAPIINDEENETLERLVRKVESGESFASLEGVFVSGQILNETKYLNDQSYCKTLMEIKNIDGKLEYVGPEKKLETNNESFFYGQNEVIIYAYSASRRLGKENTDDPKLEDTIQTFVADETTLYDAEDVLHQLHYAMLGAEGKERKDHVEFLKNIKKMLADVLPDVKSADDIEVTSPKMVGGQKQAGGVYITSRNGKKIPFRDASLGYRTNASWTIDLVWRLSKQYPESKAPLKEPAIVLIDEIDLHLHPIWQREIMDNLSEHFPNVQFIATAHSPLMVQAAIDANYAVLQYSKRDHCTTIENTPKGIDGWRVDQILTSEFFGLISSRGLIYEDLMNKRRILTNKDNLTAADKKELKNIERQLMDLPTGENPEEIENRKYIADLIDQFRKGNKKIEL